MPNIDFYYKRSRLNQLKGFCSVVQNDCCIAKASKKTNVAQDTISKQVRTLERDLKIKLFERTKHHTLIITQEGQLFYDKAIANLNAMNSLFENFHKDLKEFNNNHLRIAAHQMAITYILPKIIGKMLKLKEFKNLKITLYSVSKEEAIKKLINKEIDIGFYIFSSRNKIEPEIELIKNIQSYASIIINKDNKLANKEKIESKDIETLYFLNRETELNTFNNFDINCGNLEIVGQIPQESLKEIAKYTDLAVSTPNLFLKMKDDITDKNIKIKNIEHILNHKAFFFIMLLKNSCLTKPALWFVDELKKIN